jgi:type II secretory pathway pseudopilin PulG
MALVAIVVVGIFAGVANLATSRIVQADREEELMFRGQAYRKAIQHYYAVAGRYPRTLDELLKDPRSAHRTYLRAVYGDPMASGEGEKKENGGWRLLRAADGGIAGVASRSKQEPLKKANFPLGLEAFENASSYSEWVFEYAPHPVGGSNPPVKK